MTRCSSVATVLCSTLALALPPPSAEGESGVFAGTWIASGTRQPFAFVEGREVFPFQIEGHVNLRTGVGETEDFWSTCVGLWDSQTGGTTRCVWRSMDGDRVYSVLRGEPLRAGVAVTGEIVGGTGALDGITGSYEFTWHTLDDSEEDDVLTGHARDLNGSFEIP